MTARPSNPGNSTTDDADEIVCQTMVRVNAEDYACLMAVGRPGEARAHIYARAVREAVIPPTIILRYRKAPLFPTWLEMGPMSPLAADTRGRMFLASGWEVEARSVAPRPLAPMWPDDDNDDQEDE